MVTTQTVEAVQRTGFLVDQVQVYWMIQTDQQYAFLSAGTIDEIEITLVRDFKKTEKVVRDQDQTPEEQLL